MNELSLYYQQLSEAKIKMKKDKFSFRIRGYVPVFGNDFSTNYTSSFRMKKDKKAKEEINSIFSRMNKSTNKSVDTNSTQNEELQRTNSYVLRELLDDDQLSLNDEISEDNDSRSLKSEKGMKFSIQFKIKDKTYDIQTEFNDNDESLNIALNKMYKLLD